MLQTHQKTNFPMGTILIFRNWIYHVLETVNRLQIIIVNKNKNIWIGIYAKHKYTIEVWCSF